MKAKNLVVLWKERLSAVMFTDFVRKNFLNGKKVETSAITLFDDVDFLKQSDLYNKLLNPGDSTLILFVKETKVVHPENKILVLLKEVGDLVYSIDMSDPSKVTPIFVKEGLQESSEYLLSEWESAIKGMAASSLS